MIYCGLINMSVSPYFSDKTVISSIRKYYNENEQYTINFQYWINTAKKVKDGILIRVENRKFLIEEYTGSVIKEVM